MIRKVFILSVLCPTMAFAQAALSGVSGDLRVLDKVTGEVHEVSLAIGGVEEIGALKITLDDCRVPRVNPTGDAYAQITVNYRDNADPAFAGWLIASAPALNAMDHPRYDIWALRCSIS